MENDIKTIEFPFYFLPLKWGILPFARGCHSLYFGKCLVNIQVVKTLLLPVQQKEAFQKKKLIIRKLTPQITKKFKLGLTSDKKSINYPKLIFYYFVNILKKKHFILFKF